jgi:stage V sporulation protein SpoVS
VRLLLDEDSGAHSLVTALRADGHDVERVVDAIGAGSSDDAVFQHAVATRRVLLTSNGADFLEIASRPGAPAHPGIVVMHYDAEARRLADDTIVCAVANIQSTYDTTESLLLRLNQHVW